MSQSQRQTVIEVVSNTSIGMLGSWLITVGVMYLIPDLVTAASINVLLCTIWSLGRGYAVRRYFNARSIQEQSCSKVRHY